MNETIKTIENLRSIHGTFSDKEVSTEDLETVINSALRAANAGNMQTYSVVVYEDRENMKHLCQYTGSKALIFCVDHTRAVQAAKELGSDFTPKTAGWFITGCTDAILAAQTAAIAAKSLGIDSLFTSALYRGDFDRVYNTLGIPEKYCFPLITLVLGYPKFEPEYKKGRLNGKGVVHYGTYKKLNDDEMREMIEMYDDPEKHLGIPIAGKWSDRGFKHYLDVIFNFWGKGGADESSSKLFAALKRAGYLDDEERVID